MFDRETYFDAVRSSLFGGQLSQQQVDGQEAVLKAFEDDYLDWDLRWLGYCLATSKHETSSTMWPIAEYGEGKGQPYGEPDPDTGERYYGRGLVQLTWADNYARADDELGLEGDDACHPCADNQLRPEIAVPTMFQGMSQGWFRGDKLADYFNATRDDPYGAREIINGDKTYTPDWAGGDSIGELIESYHGAFLAALRAAAEACEPLSKPPPAVTRPPPKPKPPAWRRRWDQGERDRVSRETLEHPAAALERHDNDSRR